MTKSKTLLVFSNHQKLAFVVIAAVGILVLRFFQVLGQPQPLAGVEVKIIGRVSAEPVIIGQSQYFQIEDKFRVRTRIFPKYHYGDRLEIVGTQDENLLIAFPEIKKIGEDGGILSFIFTLRRFLLSLAAKIWPEPEASLFTGVILGQDAISSQFRQVLVATGTIHIVVVSGQNVAMLAGFILATLSLLGRKKVAIWVISAIIFYTLLTGAQPPTVRAAIMGSLAFLAKLTGRENWPFWGLTAASFGMLFFDPKLIFDISFQLSFAATFGILALQPALAKIFANFWPKILKEALTVTLAAWVFTAPIIAFYFSQFTPVTPFSNLLVLPVVPFLMIGGAVTLLAGAINLFFGQITGALPFAAAFYFTNVVENLAKLPFSTVSLPQINIFLIAAFYSVLITLVIWSQKILAKE